MIARMIKTTTIPTMRPANDPLTNFPLRSQQDVPSDGRRVDLLLGLFGFDGEVGDLGSDSIERLVGFGFSTDLIPRVFREETYPKVGLTP